MIAWGDSLVQASLVKFHTFLETLDADISDIILEPGDWYALERLMPQWAIVPGTEDYPPFLWFEGRRIHIRPVEQNPDKMFYAKAGVFDDGSLELEVDNAFEGLEKLPRAENVW